MYKIFQMIEFDYDRNPDNVSDNDQENEELPFDKPLDTFKSTMLTFAGFVLFMNLLLNIYVEVEQSMKEKVETPD